MVLSELRIHLFGYPRVEVDGEPIAVARRKSLALLAYLAVSGAHQGRDALAALLWPEQESSKAYAFLRNALWVLNQTPLASWLTSSRHTVGLHLRGDLWIDVRRFREHAGSAREDEPLHRLQEAARIADAPFLSGFSIDDSWPFEEWQLAEADALQLELAHVLERLTDRLAATGKHQDALLQANRLLEIRPLDEAAYRRVMLYAATLGNRMAAMRTYETCRKMLRDELALAPSPETERLMDEIRAGSVECAPIARPQAVPQHLPVSHTPFVGREAELDQLVSLLASPDCRLLTVTGTGGSGKTRLAVECAARSAPTFPDGIFFVSLAAIERSDTVAPAILDALGESLPHLAGGASQLHRDALSELLSFLADRELLLVLDNVEQLSRDLRWLAALMAACTKLTLLATSRQELQLPGETVFAIDGLPCAISEPHIVSRCPAVTLFLQIARQSDARFTPSETDLEVIGGICRRLDGIPLAIELAASWTRALSCEAIADELERGFDFLETQKTLVPRRHRSLRTAFEGSWALLDRESRRVFRRLSVFREGFTLEAARRVVDADVPALARLTRKSLLRRLDSNRYAMLEIVRQYAEERLRAQPDEKNETDLRMAEYYLTLLVSVEADLKAEGQRKALDRITADKANVYAAWRQAVASGRFDLIEAAALGLFLFCDMTTRFDDGAELFREAAGALTASGRPPDPTLRSYVGGLFAWFSHFADPTTGRELFHEFLDGAPELPATRALHFMQVLATYARAVGPDAATRLEAARTFFEDRHLEWELATADEAIAGLLLDKDAHRAEEAALRSVELRHRRGDRWGEALARYTLGQIFLTSGRLDEAQREFERSAALRTNLDVDPFGVFHCLLQLGHVELRREHPERALQFYREAKSRAAELSQELGIAWAREFAGSALLALGRLDEAQAEVQAALHVYDALAPTEDWTRGSELLESIARARKPERESGRSAG